jgi:hypothetical protein
MPRTISNPTEPDPRWRNRPSGESCDQTKSWTGNRELTRTGTALAGNRLIQRLLASLSDQVPRAALVSLSILGMDEREWDGGRSYYRVTNRATPGKRLDALTRRVTAVPAWQALLPPLRAGRSVLLRVADLRLGPPSEWLSPTRVAHVLACPATSPPGDPTGAVFIVFDIGDRAPRGAELRRLRAQGARIGSQIAAVLDLMRHAPTPSPYAEAA